MSLQQNELLGPYQILGLLGEGGMGAVYRARDTRLGRDVAIKVLTAVAHEDRDRLQRFEQEARATGMLNHPNLLTVFDVGSAADGTPYIVSEVLEGESLRSRLERGPLSPRRAVDAALQMANGLAAAHEKGIVHRDLKPDNVFLTRDGRLKILDFGIAKLTSPGSDGPTFQMASTEPGMVLGTVGYMSPEQVRGESLDTRSDIFSLGTIFYEMLTGTRAFKRDSAIETLSAILKEEPPDLSEILPSIPMSLEKLIRRCLEKDRDLRFHSASDLAFNLETLAAMSMGGSSLSSVARPAVSGAQTAVRMAPGTPQAARSTATGLAATNALPTAQTEARTTRQPVQPSRVKARRGVSPLLLSLLFLVSVAGAAYAGWIWAHRGAKEKVEPQFDRVTFRRGEVRSARFSPDGETIVYSAAWDGRQPETFVASRHATEARPLGVADSEVLSVSRSAELAILLRRDRFTNLGTLARVPLAGGVPRELAENVIQADWSPDGTNLAIIRQVNGRSRIEYPIGTVKYETAHFVRDVRVSPDGKRLAILEPSQGEFDLAIVENGPPTTIARGWRRGATGIAWAPDGNEIWISGTSTAAPPALHAVTLDGATRLVSKLTGAVRMFDLSPRREALISNGTWRAALAWKPRGANPVAVAPPATAAPAAADATSATAAPPFEELPERDASWLDWSMLADLSPDGRTILFSETREGGGARSGVYLRRVDASAPVHLGDGIADALSPDGKWVLCHQGPKLAILPTGTGEARELKVEGAFDGGAVWMPDSRRVIIGGVIGNDGFRLHLIDTLDETSKPISGSNIWSSGSRSFVVSPDGRFVAGMSSEEKVTVFPLDGSKPVAVPGTEKGEIPVQWLVDGAILVYRPTAIPARLFRIDLATGVRTLWKEFNPADPAGVYKVAPVVITQDGNAWAYNAMRVLSDLYVAEGLE